MELKEVKNLSLDLIENSKAAYLTTIDTEGYTDIRLDQDTVYYYRVSAFNSLGDSGPDQF